MWKSVFFTLAATLFLCWIPIFMFDKGVEQEKTFVSLSEVRKSLSQKRIQTQQKFLFTYSIQKQSTIGGLLFLLWLAFAVVSFFLNIELKKILLLSLISIVTINI